MALQTRNSVLAVVAESTEGTPVAPSAGSDAVPIQDDAAMTADRDTLENAELRSSIGLSKAIQGKEAPTSSFSLYLKHSGVEGQAPGYNEILKAAFGNEDVEGTEYDTVAASTATTVKVDSGEGANFRLGQALLVKHPSNAYEIRVVNSVSTDDLDMSFSLDNAPGTGVNLGKAVTYYPANTGHQSLSLWHYLANSGGIQMISGARPTSVSMTFTAGELINVTYNFEGLEYYFNPIEITAADTYLDFTDDNGTFAAQITAKMYKDPHDLAAAIQTAMNTVQTAETHTCTYSDDDGKFTIASTTSSVLTLLWNTGTNAANTVGDQIGFSVAADDSGATSYEGDSAKDWSFSYTASFDDSDPLIAQSNQLFIGDQEDNVCVSASEFTVTMDLTRTENESICADSGVSDSLISGREVTMTSNFLLDQHDVDKFRRFRENRETRVQYNFGTKSGGNWVAGKSGAVYCPTSTVSSFNLEDDEGLVSVALELKAYVGSTDEIFLSLV
jgi:hypothetical protein